MTRALLLIASLALAACDTTDPDPQGTWWTSLQSHCGKAYSGRVISNDETDASLRQADLLMHVRECSDTRIAIPFHIREKRADGEPGEWDRSRTWVVTRTDAGLRLKHDHRHQDGSSDDVTMYGGDTIDAGNPQTQAFPVDAESIALFRREDLAPSIANTWRISVDPAGADEAIFVYALNRPKPNARDFRARFDLTRPVDAPPAPWGHEDPETEDEAAPDQATM